MAGDSHDVLVQALRDDPSLLRSLIARLKGRELPGPLRPGDSTVRLARPAEVRPDVVCRMGESWVACEVQNKIDPRKKRRWPLAVALLHNETGHMGELVVITASAAVARWAASVAHLRGPVGTAMPLSPLVLHLDPRRPELLDPRWPELSWCAVWAVRHRHGEVAAQVVERAVELTGMLSPPLRNAQLRAIFELLSARMRARLQKDAMNPDNIPESPATRKLRLFIESIGEKRGRAKGEAEGRAKGEAEGRAASLLLVLEQRGIAVSNAERARILACSDVGQLDTWLRRALISESAADVLAAAPQKRPRARRPATSRPAAARARSSRS